MRLLSLIKNAKPMKIERLLAIHQKDPSDGVALYRLARAYFDGQQFADAYGYANADIYSP
jgi:cytochrome c-type biogenesis protein CcmH/NrfG